MSEAQKVKGPASYFPSIEKTYGKPISHWMEVLTQAGELKHMQFVSLLKATHELGHANALVAPFWPTDKHRNSSTLARAAMQVIRLVGHQHPYICSCIANQIALRCVHV